MMTTVQKPLEKELIKRLVDEFQPEVIYLFGSRAWGKARTSSDYDLLIVVSDSNQSPVARAVRAQRSLRGLMAPVDVLIKTRAEFDRSRQVYASLDAEVYEKGKILYARENRPGQKLVGQSIY